MTKRNVVIEIMSASGVEPENLEKLAAWDGKLLAVCVGERGMPFVDLGSCAFKVSEGTAAQLRARFEEHEIEYERTSQRWAWRDGIFAKALAEADPDK